MEHIIALFVESVEACERLLHPHRLLNWFMTKESKLSLNVLRTVMPEHNTKRIETERGKGTLRVRGAYIVWLNGIPTSRRSGTACRKVSRDVYLFTITGESFLSLDHHFLSMLSYSSLLLDVIRY
jgi:hypothetical protein